MDSESLTRQSAHKGGFICQRASIQAEVRMLETERMVAVATAPSQSHEEVGEAALGAAALADPSGLLPHCPSPACLLLSPSTFHS